jgi:hypothetical protein
MWQRIAFAVPLVLLGCFLVAIGRTAQAPVSPDDHMAIMVSQPELSHVQTEIRSLAAARNFTVADRPGHGGDSAFDWQIFKDGQLRIEAGYDAYRSVIEICFFKAAGDDYVAEFKEALRRSLAGT